MWTLIPESDCSSQRLGEQGRWAVNQLPDEIVHLPGEIEQTEARLEQLTTNDSFVTTLRVMNGLGRISAVTLRAESGTMSRFRSGQQAALFFCAGSNSTRP